MGLFSFNKRLRRVGYPRLSGGQRSVLKSTFGPMYSHGNRRIDGRSRKLAMRKLWRTKAFTRTSARRVSKLGLF